MKRLFLIPLMIVLVGGLIFGGCAAPAPAPAPKPEPIVLKGLAFLPPDRDTVIGLKTFADRVNEKAKGELIIDVIGGPEVIGMFDQPEAVKDGTIDIILTPTAFYGTIVPEGLVLPVSEYEAWEERENGFYDWLNDLHKEKMGVYYLGRTQNNFGFKLYSNKRVDTPQDIAGQKLGVTPLWMPFAKALGAAGVMIEEPELYTALDRGVIDGYILPEVAVMELSVAEITKYGIDHPFYSASNLVHIVNLDTWNRLPKHLQDLMTDESIKLERDMWDFYGENLAKAQKENEATGIEYITFSPDDAKSYLELANSSYWEDVRGKVSPENYTTLRKFLTK